MKALFSGWGGTGRRSSSSSFSLYNLGLISKQKPRTSYAPAHSLLNEGIFFKKLCPLTITPTTVIRKRTKEQTSPCMPSN